MLTLNDFRAAGSKIRVNFYRQYEIAPKQYAEFSHKQLRMLDERKEYDPKKLHPRGGRTKIEVTVPEGITLVGESICSMKDNFNRKLGRKIAVARLLEEHEKFLVPTSTLYGGENGELILGMYYYCLVGSNLYEYYPPTLEHAQEVIRSKTSLKSFNQLLDLGHLKVKNG